MFCAFSIFENLVAFHLRQGKGGKFLMDWLEEHTESPMFSGERTHYHLLFLPIFFFHLCSDRWMKETLEKVLIALFFHSSGLEVQETL